MSSCCTSKSNPARSRRSVVYGSEKSLERGGLGLATACCCSYGAQRDSTGWSFAVRPPLPVGVGHSVIVHSPRSIEVTLTRHVRGRVSSACCTSWPRPCMHRLPVTCKPDLVASPTLQTAPFPPRNSERHPSSLSSESFKSCAGQAHISERLALGFTSN